MRLHRLCVLAFFLLPPPADAQDYARERRLEAEIVPALIVGEPVKLLTAAGREFLAIHAEAKPARGAVVLVHGRNVHPDHEVIGALRMRLFDRGYTTLSIQMPVLGPEARRVEDYYPALFPEAVDRIAIAAQWLSSRGAPPLALVSHSMGSWMANEHFDARPSSPYAAWVCLGLTGGFSWGTYRSSRPILDVSGSEDLPAVVDGAWRRRLALGFAPEGSRQVIIEGADHMFTGRDGELAKIVADWLDAVLR
jgi:alpha/beta superfamily hydrolase